MAEAQHIQPNHHSSPAKPNKPQSLLNHAQPASRIALIIPYLDGQAGISRTTYVPFRNGQLLRPSPSHTRNCSLLSTTFILANDGQKSDISLGGVAPSMTPKTTDSQCPIEATQDRLRQNPPCHSCVGATTILGNISLFKFASETNGCPWRARPRHPALRSTAHLS